MNATLTINWPSGATMSYRAEWRSFDVILDDGVLNELFFSDKFESEWDKGHPDMDVSLNGNPEIRSRVVFEDNVGDIYSTRNLDNLLKNES